MNRGMPDVVSAEKPEFSGKLEWVGMDEVELPVQLGGTAGSLIQTPAQSNIYVNLTDESAKGIHMSRLFLAATEALSGNKLDPNLIEKILNEFLSSHEGISDTARIELSFEYLTLRSSLKSNNKAWRNYPILILAEKKRGEAMKLELGLDIQYSSTCPCSAALSRQMNQAAFKQKFSQDPELNYEDVLNWLGKQEAVAATPHAQRSLASVFLSIEPNANEFEIEKYIDVLEDSLATPVQAAVKREDEQEFARLNATNLMFGEDASRRLQASLNALSEIKDFRGKVHHFESLHPHNAVSSFRKKY